MGFYPSNHLNNSSLNSPNCTWLIQVNRLEELAILLLSRRKCWNIADFREVSKKRQCLQCLSWTDADLHIRIFPDLHYNSVIRGLDGLLSCEIIFCRTGHDALKRSFSYRGAMAWNQLSNVTREMGDLTSFKLAIS